MLNVWMHVQYFEKAGGRMRWVSTLLQRQYESRECVDATISSKRKFLSLVEKIEILDVYDDEKLSCRALTEKIEGKFGVGKTQVAEIIKNAKEIRKVWTTNGNEERKRMKIWKTPGKSENGMRTFEYHGF